LLESHLLYFMEFPTLTPFQSKGFTLERKRCGLRKTLSSVQKLDFIFADPVHISDRLSAPQPEQFSPNILITRASAGLQRAAVT